MLRATAVARELRRHAAPTARMQGTKTIRKSPCPNLLNALFSTAHNPSDPGIYVERILSAIEQKDRDRGRRFLLDYHGSQKELDKPVQEEKSKLLIPADTSLCNMILNEWAGSENRKNGENAEMLLKMMWRESESGRMPNCKPDKYTYTFAIDCCLATNDLQSAIDRAISLLQDMRKTVAMKVPEDQIEVSSYNKIMSALSKIGSRPQRIEEILKQLEKDFKTGVSEGPPDRISMYALFASYSQSNLPEAAKRMQMHLDRIESEYDSIKPDQSVALKPPLLHLWAISKQQDAAERANAILYQLIEAVSNGDFEGPLEIVHFNVVINCWSESDRPDAPEKAQQIFDTMVKMAGNDEKTNWSPKPDIITISSLMKCWAKSKRPDAPERALEIFNQILAGSPEMKPDTVSYNIVIGCWARSDRSNAPEMVQKIFDRMLTDENAQPDHVTYFHVLGCWAKSKRPKGVDKARIILSEMIERHKVDPNKSPGPKIKDFEIVINGYAELGDIKQAKKLLQMASEYSKKYPAAEPGKLTYALVCKAYSKSRHATAPEETEEFVAELWDRYRSGDLSFEPDPQVYASIASCWGKSKRKDAVERAEMALREMQKHGLQPNTLVYAAVCEAWMLSGRRGSHEKIMALLKEMTDSQVRQNSFIFQAALRSIEEGDAPNKKQLVQEVCSMMKAGRVEPSRLSQKIIKRFGIVQK